MTIGSAAYRVYRYEGKHILLDNAAMLLCWKEGEGFEPQDMKAFLSTDVSLTQYMDTCRLFRLPNY